MELYIPSNISVFSCYALLYIYAIQQAIRLFNSIALFSQAAICNSTSKNKYSTSKSRFKTHFLNLQLFKYFQINLYTPSTILENNNFNGG